jgi:hypothetical protein
MRARCGARTFLPAGGVPVGDQAPVGEFGLRGASENTGVQLPMP